ncbi:unnamed protein product [Vicia faba]|uniref:CCHC-type domain-containing protein n=1 Tax=Vicia faba TaxID=3906 RepID=A0AAV1B937_VICFA|nr:unnamed protein product [Vicia faba]
MSNLAKLDFGALDISEKNYLPWALDVEIHLNPEGHINAIKEGNTSSDQQKAKVMIFLRRYFHEDLKNEYLTHDTVTMYKIVVVVVYMAAVVVVPIIMLVVFILIIVTMKIIGMYLFNRSGKILEKGGQSSKNKENICYRCGRKGHWSRTFRTPKHLVDLYKKSLKSTNTRIETHFVNEDGDPDYGNIDVTHLEIGDFFVDPDGKIDHLIGDGIVKK